MKKIVYLIATSLLLCACQTTPKRYEKVFEGEWKVKVLIKDKVNNQSHILNLNIKAIQNKKLRFDATTPSGLHIASLALVGEKVQYMLVRERKFFRGKSSHRSMKPLLKIPMNPKLLHNIIFDIPTKDKDWLCENNKEDYLVSCSNEPMGLNIEWVDRKQTSKLVKIEHAKANIQMKFQDFQSRIAKRNQVFKLKIPKGFKIYRLR